MKKKRFFTIFFQILKHLHKLCAHYFLSHSPDDTDLSLSLSLSLMSPILSFSLPLFLGTWHYFDALLVYLSIYLYFLYHIRLSDVHPCVCSSNFLSLRADCSLLCLSIFPLFWHPQFVLPCNGMRWLAAREKKSFSIYNFFLFSDLIVVTDVVKSLLDKWKS